jgi:hypothetical protein
MSSTDETPAAPAPKAKKLKAPSVKLGDTVIYTPREDIANRYTWREMPDEFAALVTFVGEDGVTLYVMPPCDAPFAAEGVVAGDGPHTFRLPG